MLWWMLLTLLVWSALDKNAGFVCVGEPDHPRYMDIKNASYDDHLANLRDHSKGWVKVMLKSFYSR